MVDEIDVNEQYEQIFGKTERPNIFSSDDEEYNVLRKVIRESKREYNFQKSMPFTGIKLSSYEDFTRAHIVEEATKKGYRIFYIRQYEGEKMTVYAAGYFDTKTSTFVVLRDSFFQQTQYFTDLICRISNPGKRVVIRKNFKSYPNFVRQENQMHYESAALAASIFLGRKSDFRAWKDDRGKTLDAYFLRYKDSEIVEQEYKTFPDYIAPPKPLSFTDKATTMLGGQKNKTQETQPQKHLFYINVKNHLRASGYFDTETHYFYICKDSYILSHEDYTYVNTQSSLARKRFLESVCFYHTILGLYRVTKDAKCRSASAAACYVLGKNANYSEWVDDKGKCLNDCYPEIFQSEDKKQHSFNPSSQSESLIHTFYIKKNYGSQRSCRVMGIFDTKTKKFILKKDSILCLTCVPSFDSSSIGISRKIFLNHYCTKESGGYRVKQDVTFDSPSSPASFALGRSANGWLEWKDQNGLSLDTLYRNKN